MRRELRLAAKAVALEVLNTAHRPLAARRFREAVMRTNGGAKVAIGAGQVTLPDWLNTDVDYRAPYYLNLLKPWPVQDGSVRLVYADNVIEHFTVADGRVVLRHLFDALAPGGRVRLATPDVERTARAYLDRTDVALRHLERHRNRGYSVHYPVDLLRVTFAEAEHYLGFCYDFEALSTELSSAGFVDVERTNVGISSDPELEGLEARASETEAAFSLIVEARRPD